MCVEVQEGIRCLLGGVECQVNTSMDQEREDILC